MRPESGTPIHKVRLQSTNIWQYLRLVTAITIIFLTATASAVQSSPTAHGASKTAPHKTSANGDKATGTKAGDPTWNGSRSCLRIKRSWLNWTNWGRS